MMRRLLRRWLGQIREGLHGLRFHQRERFLVLSDEIDVNGMGSCGLCDIVRGKVLGL
jgi:hypothetical protein